MFKWDGQGSIWTCGYGTQERSEKQSHGQIQHIIILITAVLPINISYYCNSKGTLYTTVSHLQWQKAERKIATFFFKKGAMTV